MLDEFTRKQRVLQERIGARNAIQARLEEYESEVVLLTERMADTEKAVYLLQKYSEDQQAMLSARIEEIVTAGIRAVFQDPNLTFRMHYSESKKGTVKKAPEVTMSVSYRMADGSEAVGDLKNSFGGGLAVVTAALLNIIVVLQLAPRVAPILLWDEPLKDLSPDYGTGDDASRYRDLMADFIRTVVDEMAETGVQIIMVSHEPEYGRVADYHHRFNGGIGKKAVVKTYERDT